MNNVKKHFWHYFVYLVIFCGGLYLILTSQGNSSLEARYIIFIGILYFAWAMVHHYVHHELNFRIINEYILIVILGVVLSLFLFGI